MLAFALLLALAQDRTSSLPPGPDEGTSPAPRCGASPDDITVCGKTDQSRFRIGPLDAQRFEPEPIRPDFRLPGGGTGTVEAIQHNAGITSAPAAMVTLKIPLGRKPKPKEPEGR